mgnify:CR=1 FL=1
MTLLTLLGNIAVLTGSAIFVLAAVGLLRFRDVYARISAVATAGGLGVVFICGGAALLQPATDTFVKVVVAIILQLLTSAVGAIVISRAAVRSGHRFIVGTDTRALGAETTEDES